MQEAPQSSALSRLISHGGVYAVARVASQAAAFLLVPLYTHALGSEGLGIVEVANAARGVLTFVLLQGMHASWLRLRYDFADAEHRRRFETTVAWYLVLSIGAVCAFGIAFGGMLWDALLPDVAFQPYGALAVIGAAGAAVATLLDRKLQTDQNARAFAVVTVVRTVGTLLLIVAFVSYGRGARGKLEAEAAAGAIGAIAFWVMLKPGPLRDFSPVEAKRAVAYGWPMIPQGIAGLVNDAVDRVMINAFVGLAATGVYSLGYRVATVSMILMMAVNQALSPLFTESMHAAETEPDPAKAALRRAEVAKLGTVVLTLGVLLAQAVAAFGPELIAVLGTGEFARSWHVLALVSAGSIAWVCYAIFSQSLIYRKAAVRYLPVITIAAAAVNVGANWLLLPQLEIIGAGCATLLSNTTLAVLALVIGQRTAPVPYPWPRWCGLLALSALGLALLTGLELAVSSLVLRELLKLGWLALFALAVARTSGVKREDLRRSRA